MKLLLDEMYSDEIAVQLRRRGHDVLCVGERADLAGSPDETVFAVAAGEGRAVVTNDVEDYVSLFSQALVDGRDHAGLLLTNDRSFPRTKAGIGAVVRALDRFLRTDPADDALRNGLGWLAERR